MSMGISLWVLNIKCVYISYMNLYTFLIWFCIHSNEFVCTLNEFVDWTMLMPSECVFSICNSMAWPLPIQYTCIAHCIDLMGGYKAAATKLKMHVNHFKFSVALLEVEEVTCCCSTEFSTTKHYISKFFHFKVFHFDVLTFDVFKTKVGLSVTFISLVILINLKCLKFISE